MNHIDTMKLALEALEKLIKFESDSFELGSCRIAGKAIKAPQEALAEQPAPVLPNGMTTTNELHAAIAKMQVLMREAADVIESNASSLAESHIRNSIIKDLEVQAMVESDTLLVAHLRAAALPWDQRHKSTERPQSRVHQFPADQVQAVRAELQEAVEAHGLTAKPEPTDSMGMPISCGKPLCSPGDHHPLCKLAEQPAQQQEPAWWPAVENILKEYGLQAIDFVADFKAALAEQPAPVQQEPIGYWPEEREGEYHGHDSVTAYRTPKAGWIPVYTSPQPAQRKPLTDWIAVSDRIPLESDGEVLVRMRDGRCEIAWATYWHGASNDFAQWTFRDPDEDEAPTHWMRIPSIEAAHGIKEQE